MWPCAQLQVSIKIIFPFDGEKYESDWKNKQKNFWPSVGHHCRKPDWRVWRELQNSKPNCKLLTILPCAAG